MLVTFDSIDYREARAEVIDALREVGEAHPLFLSSAVGGVFMVKVDTDPKGTHVENPQAHPPKVRKCPECGEPLTPVHKSKEHSKIVAYWECQNPECLVVKVYSRLNPKRLEVVKAHIL